jgi:phosphatidate cytidylyltransferase
MGEDDRFPSASDDGGTDAETGVGAGEVVVEGFTDEDSQRSADAPLLSQDMERDDRDSDGTDELEYDSEPADPVAPHLEPAGPDSEFDGWLDDPKERPDPYADLAQDEAAHEIADWMAFTRGDDATAEPEAAEPEPEAVEPEPEIAEPEPEAVEPEPEVIESAPVGETETDGAVADAEDAVEPSTGADADTLFAEARDDDEAATAAGEVTEAEPAETVDPWKNHDDDVLSWAEARTLEEDDTSEMDIEPAESTHEEAAVAWGDEPGSDETGSAEPGPGVEDADGAPAEPGTVFDFDEFTEETYLQTATKEHVGLAAEMALAATQDTEQVPLAAAMPGVETGTVGFEDVIGQDEAHVVTPPARGGSELALRVGSAVALIALVIVSLMWAPVLALLAFAVFLLAGWEFYAALISRQYHPLALFGLLGIAGASIGAYFDGSGAIPIALVLTVAAALLFDAVAPRKDRPDVNFALTIFVAAWIALGAFAFDIINADDYRVLVAAVVGIVALVDIAQYFAGRSFGSRQLAPVISPKKTIEGLMGGVVTALILGAALSFIAPFDLGSGLLLGAVVAVFAPLGDLAVSGVKRSLDIKDMGSIVPGHGGMLDRIDGLLFVIPAAWVAYTWLGLL